MSYQTATCPHCKTLLEMRPSDVGAINPLPKPNNFVVCHTCAEVFIIDQTTLASRPFTDKEKELFGQSRDIRKVWEEQKQILREIALS